MNEQIIDFNTKKRIKILFIGGLLIVGCLILLYYMIFIADVIKIFYVLLMLLIVCIAVYFFIVALRSILSKDKKGLILNSEGIHFKGTLNGRKIGLINWRDIRALDVGKIYSTDFVVLKLNNAEKYVQNSKMDAKSKDSIINNGVVVTNDELSITFEDMKHLIAKYYNEYKLQNSPNN